MREGRRRQSPGNGHVLGGGDEVGYDFRADGDSSSIDGRRSFLFAAGQSSGRSRRDTYPE